MTAAATNIPTRHSIGRLCRFSVAVAGLAAFTDAAFAQAYAPSSPAPATVVAPAEQKSPTSSIEDIIKKHEQDLDQARAKQRDAAEAETKLKAEIAAIGQDRNKLNRQLIDVAARVR